MDRILRRRVIRPAGDPHQHAAQRVLRGGEAEAGPDVTRPAMVVLPLVLVILSFFTSCGTYRHRAERAIWHAEHGNFDRAVKLLHRERLPKLDGLLYLLDEATILSAAGRHEESNRVFERAEEFIEREGRQPLSKTAAIVTNDNVIPYHARVFEKPYIDLFQALNYLSLGKTNEALVEIRQINTRYADHFKKDAKTFLQSGAVKFVSANVWEAAGKMNDAYLDEKWLARHGKRSPDLGAHLLDHCRRLGLEAQCSEWRKQFPKSPTRVLGKNEGEVVILLGVGSVPLKESSEAGADLQFVPIPRYPSDLPETIPVQITVGNQEWSATVFEDFAATVTGALDDEMPEILARAAARLATKVGAAVATGIKVDEELGILTGLLLMATNRADLRSWATLPRSFQGARFVLPAGRHRMVISAEGSSRTFEAIDVTPGKSTFVIARFF